MIEDQLHSDTAVLVPKRSLVDTDSVDARFGRRLVMLRKRAEWSQQELAGALNIPLANVAGWETGTMSASLEDLKLLADVFGNSVSELLTGV